MIKRIGVLTSGGDCPGVNAVLRGVVRAATNRAWEVIGFHDGFEGLLPPAHHEPLTMRRTAGIMHLGGTILGTTNRGHFIVTDQRKKKTVPAAVIDQTRKTLRDLGISALIIVGGDGSLTISLELHEACIPVVGVPKTIDNDLEATAMSFGFDSAVACVAGALDRLHTTATSHRRVMVIEVMGRQTGWIALYGGLAGGADIILIPEIPFDHERVAAAVRQREAEGCMSTLVVVAEGATEQTGQLTGKSGAEGEINVIGMGEAVATAIIRRTGKETRTCVLGHLQRGGAPTSFDRVLATRFGGKAVELVRQREFGTMVAFDPPDIVARRLDEVVGKTKLVPMDFDLLLTARALGVTFGD
jgi:ATP-dependent phosphofructokinase / diphosphate-dependent phosphofructokinase